jgi:hypothetical protein
MLLNENNMRMKNVMLGALLMGSSILYAQDHHSRGHRPDKLHIKETLKLTDEQDAKLSGINEQFRLKYTELKTDSLRPREVLRSEKQKLKSEREAEVKGVLTEKQYAQWIDLKKQHRGNRNPGGHRLSADALKQSLALSNDQYTKVSAIDSRFQDRFKKIYTDSTLSKENARGEFKKLRTEKSEEIIQVLNTDQRAKYETLKSEKHKQKGHRRHYKRR